MIRIGDRLREERTKKGLSIVEVARATKIRPAFLQAIEVGDYSKLPGSSYAHGFVKNYIEFLGLPIREYMAMFRREFNEKEYLGIIPDSFVQKEDIPLKTVRLNRTIAIAVAVIVIILSYLFFQYRSSVFSPTLAITSPLDKAKIAAQTVLVTGTTDPNSTVTVNGLPAFVDPNGKFSKEIPVFPGVATISIKSVNNFGRVTLLERHVVVSVAQ